jgi:LemA protein
MTPVNPEVSTPAPAPRRKFAWGWIILILVVVFLVLSGISAYNRFVRLDQVANEKWANIETQLQRRGDLIGNLVATVKRYAEHEEEVFIEVAKARSSLNNAATPEEYAKASGEISQALSRLMVVVEQYPELKANENFLQLQAQIEGTENRINYARLEYNTAIKDYNIAIKRFPAVLFAGLFGFHEREPFEAEEGAKINPDVEDLFDR